MQNLNEVNLNELSTEELIKGQLSYALKRDGTWLQSLQILKERGEDVRKISFYLPSASTCSAIHMAAYYDNIGVLKFLIDEAGEHVDKLDAKGGTALMACLTKFSWSAETGTVDFLLSREADPNKENIYGVTPLNLAASFGMKDALESLKKASANINATNKLGEVPLSTIIHGNAPIVHPRLIECVEWFLENGAKLELVKPFNHMLKPTEYPNVEPPTKSQKRFWADFEKQVDLSNKTPEGLIHCIVKYEAFTVDNLHLIYSLLTQHSADPKLQKNTEDLSTFEFFCDKFLPKAEDLEDLIQKSPDTWKLIVDTVETFIFRGIQLTLPNNIRITRVLFDLGVPLSTNMIENQWINDHPEYEQFRSAGIIINGYVYSLTFIGRLQKTLAAEIGQSLPLLNPPESSERAPVTLALATQIGTIIREYYADDSPDKDRIKEEVKEKTDDSIINIIEAATAHRKIIIAELITLAHAAGINDEEINDLEGKANGPSNLDSSYYVDQSTLLTHESLQKFLTIWLIGHIKRTGKFDPNENEFIKRVLELGGSFMQANLMPSIMTLSSKKSFKEDEKTSEEKAKGGVNTSIENDESQMFMDAIIGLIEQNGNSLDISPKGLVSLMNLKPNDYYGWMINYWDKNKHGKLLSILEEKKKHKDTDKNEVILYEKIIAFLNSVNWIVDQLVYSKEDEKHKSGHIEYPQFSQNDLFQKDTSFEFEDELKLGADTTSLPSSSPKSIETQNINYSFGIFAKQFTEQKPVTVQPPIQEPITQELVNNVNQIILDLKKALEPLNYILTGRRYLAELSKLELENASFKKIFTWLENNTSHESQLRQDLEATASIREQQVKENTEAESILEQIKLLQAILDRFSELADQKMGAPKKRSTEKNDNQDLSSLTTPPSSDPVSTSSSSSSLSVASNPFASFYQHAEEKKPAAVQSTNVDNTISGLITAFVPLKHRIKRDYLKELRELNHDDRTECGEWVRTNGPQIRADLHEYAQKISGRDGNSDKRTLDQIQKILAILDTASKLADQKMGATTPK